MREDYWLAKNSLRIRDKYQGKAIAIWQNRVIAVGRDAVDVAEKADKIAPPHKWLLVCLEHEPFDFL